MDKAHFTVLWRLPAFVAPLLWWYATPDTCTALCNELMSAKGNVQHWRVDVTELQQFRAACPAERERRKRKRHKQVKPTSLDKEGVCRDIREESNCRSGTVTVSITDPTLACKNTGLFYRMCCHGDALFHIPIELFTKPFREPYCTSHSTEGSGWNTFILGPEWSFSLLTYCVWYARCTFTPRNITGICEPAGFCYSVVKVHSDLASFLTTMLLWNRLLVKRKKNVQYMRSHAVYPIQ